MNLSFQKLFYAIATAFALFAILILAKSILIPLAFAMLVSFILFPLARKLESWGVNRMLSAFLTIFSLILLIGGGILLFSAQLIDLARDFTNIRDKILQIFVDLTVYLNSNLSFMPTIDSGDLVDKLKEWLQDSAGSLVGQTFSGTAAFFSGLLAAVVFTFLFLIYRDGLTQAFIHFYPIQIRKNAYKMLKAVQQVGQKYLFGMILIILILGFVNSVGLWIIGIESPFLFGFLAAVLAIVPYVGTVVGAMIPILYALVSYDSIWMPIAVGILFWFVQLVESNFLSPKIVGGSLRINALAAILSIIIGASVWGVAGMILFLPFTAMIMVICQEYEELKPIALLIGEQGDHGNEHSYQWMKKWKEWFSKWRGS